MDESDSNDLRVSRRRVLVAAAASVGAAGVSDALDSDGPTEGGADLALGDDSETRLRNSWEYGQMSFAPSTIPPEGAPQ